MAEVDPQREIPRTDELWYFEEREDVGDWFRRHGWDVTVTPSDELMASFGRKAPKEVKDTCQRICSWQPSGRGSSGPRAERPLGR